MKKLLLIISFIISGFSFVGCSGTDDEPITPMNNVKVPSELIGTWKITRYGWVDVPNSTGLNDKGYFIKFNSDNTVEYKDVNTTYKGAVELNNLDKSWLVFPGQGRNLRFFNSQNYPGQKEFIIRYDGSTYENNILIGTKQ